MTCTRHSPCADCRRILSDTLLEGAHRVRVMDQVLPGAVGEIRIDIHDVPFLLTLTVDRTGAG